MMDGGDMAGNTTGYRTNSNRLGRYADGRDRVGRGSDPEGERRGSEGRRLSQTTDLNNSTAGSVQRVTRRGTHAYHGPLRQSSFTLVSVNPDAVYVRWKTALTVRGAEGGEMRIL